MSKKSVNSILGRGAIVLLMLTFLCISILVAKPVPPEAPVKIEISVSKDKIYVGDSIDVYATITLLEDHLNYEKGKEYRVVEQTNYTRLPSGKLHRRSNPLWEVLYSDSSKIINDENPAVNFHYRIKLSRRPDYKEVPIMSVVVREVGASYAQRNMKGFLIECLNEGLPERSKNLIEYPGGIFMPDFSLDLKIELDPKIHPHTIELEKRDILIKPEDCIRIVYVDGNFLEKYKDKQGFHVLVNSTITFIFDSPVSNVSCDASIGIAYQSASNKITFESAGTVGATGSIYFFMDGQYWQMQIELVGSYNIQGSFRYEKSGNDDYLNASGEVLLANCEDPDNPVLIDITTLNGGSYSFSDVIYPIVGIYLLLNNSECEILQGSEAGGLFGKNLGLAPFVHLEYPDDNKEIDITFTFDYEDYDLENFDFYVDSEDMAKAHNVFDQDIRAEYFSTNSLNNESRSKIFIYSWLNHGDFGNVSYFVHDFIHIGGIDYDFIYINGWASDPDQTDNSVILHELGHAYHWEFAEFIASSHSGQPHGWSQAIDDTLAWYEGFATFFSCLIKSESNDVNDDGQDWEYIDTYASGSDTIDIEFPTDNPYGNACEGAVCASLWDIYDDVETGNPDWNNDVISFGYDEIWYVMVSYKIGEEEHYCYTFNDFLNGWHEYYEDTFTTDFINSFDAHGIIYTPSCPVDPASQLMSATQLINNYPNPFTLATIISYSLAHKFKNPRIEIYNVRGQKVKTFMLEEKKGKDSIIWNGSDETGGYVSSGIYFQKLVNNNKVIDIKKMLLIK